MLIFSKSSESVPHSRQEISFSSHNLFVSLRLPFGSCTIAETGVSPDFTLRLSQAPDHLNESVQAQGQATVTLVRLSSRIESASRREDQVPEARIELKNLKNLKNLKILFNLN